MARELTTDKGFKVIVLSPEEAKSIGFGLPVEGCICYGCNGTITENMYYIAALNDVMCKECYEDWHKTAKYYTEDAEIEERYFKEVQYLLSEAAKGNTREPQYPQIFTF